jgi:hypothetical protein
MTQTAAEVFRNYVTAGVPGSGINQPAKSEISAWGTYLESLLNGSAAGLAYATVALLNADLAHAANILAIVYGDTTPANNGMYVKVGASGSGSWSRIGDLPNSIVRLTVTGGTGDAIIATAPETPTVPGAKLYLLTPTANNTTATTIVVNGGAPTPIKNAFGVDLAAGSLVNGSQVLMASAVGNYQLLISAVVDGTAILATVVADMNAAATSASSAASSASALGNQVHQYDTRALAIAATIPTGVQAIKITRFATGYPLAYATYVPGTSSGPMAFAEAGGHYWQLDTSGGLIDVKWFGATGQGSADDLATINAAISYCSTNNLTLGISDGTYNHSGTITWAYPAFKVIALGANVIFKHTGTGVAHNFNGLIYGDPSQGVMKCVFGGSHRVMLKGNPAGGTTQLAYVNNWHQGEMKIRGRDADIVLFGENTGAGQAAAVSSTFDVQVSSNGDGVPFAVVPQTALYLKNFFNCIFEKVIVEECGRGSDVACQMITSCNNVFRGGTMESNLGGGIAIDSGCFSNIFQGIDFEANGAGYDIICSGYNNLFESVTTGTTTLGSLVDGTHNKFDTCTLQSVNNSGIANIYENCVLNIGFADSGSLQTTITSPNTALTLKPGINLGLGVSFITGSGAPAMSAGVGSLYSRTDGSTTITRLYINYNGSTGWTTIAAAT